MSRVVLCAILLALIPVATAQAAPDDPLFVFSPEPPPTPLGQPPPPPIPPPNGYFNGPCGVAVDSVGRLYVSDYYHDAVDLYTPLSSTLFYAGQLSPIDPLDGPCGLALDSSGTLYVNNYHRNVARFPAPYSLGTATTLAGSGRATGVAVDPVTDDVYVAKRDAIAVYEPNGTHVQDIGVGDLGQAYGVAVSGYGATAGYVYVPDASDNTVRVYDPATDLDTPVDAIDASATAAGRFVSLRDSAIAVDRSSGDLYVLDNTQPAYTEEPEATVYAFGPTGTYRGHLKYNVISAQPPGLAVDNSATGTQGRVYVTSGNTHHAALYAYAPGAVTLSKPLAPLFPPAPLGGTQLFATTPIGAPAPPASGISCEGDACQVLPPEPTDPTLTTLLQGLGNPAVRYTRYKRHNRRCRRHKHKRRACSQGSRSEASFAAAAPRLRRRGGRSVAREPAGGSASSSSATGPAIAALLPGAAGFDVGVRAEGGAAATLAGSHPYQLDSTLALDQGGGEGDLRDLAIDLPPGLLANPAAPGLCSAAAFATPRSSPFEASQSGESCPDRSQLGTVEVQTAIAGGETRRFGLFNLEPSDGAAFQLAAVPYGTPLLLDAQIRSDAAGTHLTLQAAEIPQGLQLHALELSLWGTPWDASHNGERGNCLNEAEPSFPWARCSVGEPLAFKPLAFLTLPTRCGEPLAFLARARAWQQPDPLAAQALGRDSGGDPAPLAGCASLGFESFALKADGLLSTRKASSASGFVFRLADDDPGLADPRTRIRSLLRRITIALPRGVTLNPSLGAGLDACTPAQLAAESAFNPAGAGCPNAAKIGAFSLRVPFYDGLLKGGIYLAQPDDPSTSTAAAENPFDSLLAVYLIAKSAQRGILIRVPGKLLPDLDDGTLTATFDDLPQLPYTDLEVNFRSGQRAPLVSPPGCGPATAKLELTPWAAGVPPELSTTDSPIEAGIDFGPCPNGSTPPFAPGAITGGVNSNVGSYTPYFVHLSRQDPEQEITSYSLILPRGITGRLSGIPFCPDSAIEAARHRQGFAEAAGPSCPAASQVGRTLTGYGVGPALTYAPGRVYLAGPYRGSPLSLVTINAATIGPFDLGTIVIRSAFQVDPRTAQLRIDAGTSDPIPHIIDGVPLHLRDIRIYIDRPQFTHNPSSCEPSALESTVTGSGASFSSSADDSTATVAKHFQLLNCLTLGFRPKLGLRLRGGSRRGEFPQLRASFASRGARDSNLRRIGVTMPHSLFFAQEHIRAVCSRVQFAAERCPEDSAYGQAVAETDLFDAPLRGKVYLRSNPTNTLPDLVADLYSGSVRIVVEGQIGPSRQGGINAFFDNLPDAPIERFTMTLYGGRRGLLVNSVNICSAPPLASVKALGQNNIGSIFSSTLRGQCKKHKRGTRGSR